MLGQVGYHLAADGTGDGKVDEADYTVWKYHFGEVWTSAGSGAGGGAVVPEPAVRTLACVALFAFCFISARRRRCPQGMIAP
jgi:hypothetical protein